MQQNSDRIIVNGTIWTGDADNPWAEAIAIKGETISEVGSTQNVRASADSTTEVIDLNGEFVVSGFIDNHTHFLTGGFQLASVDLRSSSSQAEFTKRIANFIETIPKERWVLGGDWDHEAWGGELPTKEWINVVSTSNPVFVTRSDLHMGLANSVALTKAGITNDTPDPDGGTIVRDPSTGVATGVLKDEAMALVYGVIPEPSDEEYDESLQRAIAHALSKGVTQIHDVGSFGGWADLESFKRAYSRGNLGVRIYSIVPLSTSERLRSYMEENGSGDHWLWWGGVKGFVDGSLGSTTAWFYEPYEDAKETTGLPVTDTTTIRNEILAADANEQQLAVHAIGDRANDWLLSVFEGLNSINGERDRRLRIEHAQHLTSASIERFSELKITASMQPYHAIDDGRWAEKRIGAERIKMSYAFRSLLDAGVNLTFGSDWTVAPLDPLAGIFAAVTRRTIDGANPNGWVPEQKIGLEDALKAYTSSAAYAGFSEDRTGMLRAGYLADLVVLTHNLFEINPESIESVEVRRTVVGGKDKFVRRQ
ncbi:MAG: amidohydrolase [Rhodothermia bacterium]|nr:MAG: amidohydrolase [Rhodothermia bacterium]